MKSQSQGVLCANEDGLYEVIHPLYDPVQEVKRRGDNLGRIKIRGSVKASLIILRIYLLAMFLMLGYHLLDLSGVLHNSQKDPGSATPSQAGSSESTLPANGHANP